MHNLDAIGFVAAAVYRALLRCASYLLVADTVCSAAGHGVQCYHTRPQSRFQAMPVSHDAYSDTAPHAALATPVVADLLQLFYSSIRVGLLILDTDLRARVLNPAMARFTGHPFDAALGQSLDFLLGADAAFPREMALVAMATHEPRRAEYVDHRHRHWAVECVPLLETGTVRAVGLSFVDVTLRDEAELRASEARLCAVMEALPSAVLVHLDDCIVLANSAAARMLRRASTSELLGRHYLDFIPPQYHEAIAADCARTLRDRTTFECDMHVHHPDGEDQWLLVCVGPIDMRASPAVLLTMRDITDRKIVEMHLRESEERYRALIDSMPDGVIVHRERRIEFANRAAAEALGMPSPEDLRDRDVLEFSTTNARADVASIIDRVMRTGEEIVSEVRFDPDGPGHTRWIEARPRRIRFDGLPAVQVVLHEVTAQRRFQAELEEHVKRRTRELLEANGDLESFTYSVSHDLRAPLRHISGHAALLMESPAVAGDPEASRHAHSLSKAAKRLSQLVDDLLRFARTSREHLRHESLSMSAIVQDVVNGFAEEVEGRSIEWRIAPLPAVEGDAAMIRQVWENLIGNAIKYTRPRAPAIIEIGSEQRDGEMLFFVRDNGVGFDPRCADKLFGVFERLHRSDEFEGTGIGLAIVQRIVQRHGGRVWALSETGHGTTVYFTLPSK